MGSRDVLAGGIAAGAFATVNVGRGGPRKRDDAPRDHAAGYVLDASGAVLVTGDERITAAPGNALRDSDHQVGESASPVV